MGNIEVRSRARISVTVVVTLMVIVGEFVFLTWLFHLDDGADRRDRAHTGAAVALDVWRPGADREPVAATARTLAGTGIAGAARLRRDADRWAASGDEADLTALRADLRDAAEEVSAEQRRVDLEVSLVLAAVLLLVSVGWFVWFRRLVARHREIEHELTERMTVDASERRLLALVQNSTDVVVVLDPDSTVTFASPAATHVLGHDPESLLGRRLADLVVQADRPVLQTMLLSRRTDEHLVQLRMHHRDGRVLVMDGALNNLSAEPAVRGWVLTLRDVTERQRMQDDLSRQAFHDSLTGLANRQLFSDRLDHALTRRRGHQARPLAVLFLDLDDFKNVNDSLGHSTGDRLLVAVAERISQTIRPGDTAARLGGDEFGVLLEDTDLTTASQLAHRLLATLSDPVALDDHAHVVRASIGIADAVPGQTAAAETMRNADVAMYTAKERGKGGVAVYDSASHQRALETLALRQELEVAVAEGQLVVHYQPTVDLETQAITGFEALVRWAHPERGMVPPLEFIPLAEQSGLIVRLGTQVLRRAISEVASLQSAAHSPSVAVNVAAKQLTQPDFVAVVQAALEDAGLPAHRLVLEITETALLDDLDVGIAALSGLRAQGVRIAMDDFGTGYSSLSHLAQLPVDVLKVDKSFIDRLRDNEDDALVSAILAMSRGLRLTSVAEGVEDRAQADWLRGASCTLGQGYLWSRPVDLETARGLLVGSPN